VIRAEKLSKAFGASSAVRGLDLEIPPGEIYGLIGPNGAGKTTTLRMIAGLMRPSGGRASVGGVDVAADPVGARARVGYLTGSTGLYARLTVRELLAYFGRLHDMASGALHARIEGMARLMDFRDLLARRCGALSTGERQRVSLARALLHDPPALILDEPTAGLDVVASRSALRFVREAAAAGKAILFSTHYMTEAELLCRRIGLLHRGRLLEEGTPEEVMRRAGARTLEEAFLRHVERATPPPVGVGGLA
jgi:sodium transport system ATP-binding protein